MAAHRKARHKKITHRKVPQRAASPDAKKPHQGFRPAVQPGNAPLVHPRHYVTRRR